MTTSDSLSSGFAETVAIAGVGLIGGSIARALKGRGFRGQVVGVGRNADRLMAAQDAGLIDGFAERVKDIGSYSLGRSLPGRGT